MAKGLSRSDGVDGFEFYKMDYKVVMLFGLTELAAQISWVENVGRLFLVQRDVLTKPP